MAARPSEATYDGLVVVAPFGFLNLSRVDTTDYGRLSIPSRPIRKGGDAPTTDWNLILRTAVVGLLVSGVHRAAKRPPETADTWPVSLPGPRHNSPCSRTGCRYSYRPGPGNRVSNPRRAYCVGTAPPPAVHPAHHISDTARSSRNPSCSLTPTLCVAAMTVCPWDEFVIGLARAGAMKWPRMTPPKHGAASSNALVLRQEFPLHAFRSSRREVPCYARWAAGSRCQRGHYVGNAENAETRYHLTENYRGRPKSSQKCQIDSIIVGTSIPPSATRSLGRQVSRKRCIRHAVFF
jgi:hypothetical protein